MPRLEDVDVSGVHLVGAPATGRRFAIVKHLAGRQPKERTVKKSELTTALEKHEGDDVDVKSLAQLFGGEAALAKALGIPVTKQEPPKDDDDEDEDTGKHQFAQLVKSAIADAVKPLADELKLLKDGKAAAEKQALQQRAQVLKRIGYELDLEKVTEPEVAALEKAHTNVAKLAERVGLTKALGSAQRDETPTLAGMVQKAVARQLGRPPVSQDESRAARIAIYRSHPRLLTKVVEEERRARAAAS